MQLFSLLFIFHSCSDTTSSISSGIQSQSQDEGEGSLQGRERGRGSDLGEIMSSKDAYQLLFQSGVETVRAWAKTVNIKDYM